ncbi:hypothetical protein ACHAWC_005318 [Mediolabrus comicus]
MSTKHSIFTLLTLHHVVIAFQQPHQRYEHRQNSVACTTDDNVYVNIQKHENCDLLDRRIFATNTILTSLALVSIIPDNALAATDIASAPAATTPSVLEGELSVSPPPPNRAVVTDAGKPIAKPATKVKKNKSDPRFFIAGGASAAISHGITTPIDVVKTRMQSDTSLSGLSPSDAALRIVEAEGPKALTAGLGPTVIGYGVEGALKFGVYESLKPIFLSMVASGEHSDLTPDPTQPYLAAAICAGALASIILCPMEETRIKLVTDNSFAKGLLDGLPKLLNEEGFLAPFQRGIMPMLAKQVPYTMGKQVSFDIFAGLLYGTLLGLTFLPKNGIALEVEVGAAFLASIVACLASHPGDVLLTATYKDGGDTNDKNIFETIQQLYTDGGITAFFRGLNARFIHVGCIITFQLVIYDQIKQLLGLPASGT